MAVYLGAGYLGSVGCVIVGAVINNNDIKVRIAGFNLGYKVPDGLAFVVNRYYDGYFLSIH
jgi:hypothetical protein